MKAIKHSMKCAFGYQDEQAKRNGYRQILVRFPEQTFQKLALEAQREKISFASLVRRYVEQIT
jgi:hypothetical protein